MALHYLPKDTPRAIVSGVGRRGARCRVVLPAAELSKRDCILIVREMIIIIIIIIDVETEHLIVREIIIIIILLIDVETESL
jgi:hypothetical protein